MGQPVKLSDALILDARLSSEIAERSIASQIEFWAGLGKAIEPLLRFDDVLRLRKKSAAQSLGDCLSAVSTRAGQKRLKQVLVDRPYPHYEPDPKDAGVLIRTDAKGRKTRGRFVNRQFVPAK
ncbi:MAG TPA: hypothetical protein VIM61_02485 [Chthoniobacterales bacterium]